MIKNKLFFPSVVMFIVFMIMCFFPVNDAVKIYEWGYDNDNYRDMSNVNNMLAGNFVADPCYIGEYRWYNPLVHWIETASVKITGLPSNIIISQAGPYMNLLAPICFFIMMIVLFDPLIAIAAIAAFLFFTSNNYPGYFSATYSPWLYPVSFMQFAYYAGIISLFYAFHKQYYKYFIILGAVIGFAFLGHSAPAILLILQTIWLTIVSLYKDYFQSKTRKLSQLILTKIAAAIAFIIVSLPLTIFAFGKYKFHLINAATYEYAEKIFQLKYFYTLIISNLSISFFIAVAGFIQLVKSQVSSLVKNIIYSWLTFTFSLYGYVTVCTFIRFHFGYMLPGIVPSFHFFFYIKALQSVLFGFGLLSILKIISSRFIKNVSAPWHYLSKGPVILLIIAAAVLFNYPQYLTRGDFNCTPEVLNNDSTIGSIEIYKWLTAKTTINDVVLCEEKLVCFPLMASGRKMVACTQDHSNPYIDFHKRADDRNTMLAILKNKAIVDDQLFKKYDVKYFLVSNEDRNPNISIFFPLKVFTTKAYSVFSR